MDTKGKIDENVQKLFLFIYIHIVLEKYCI